MFVKFMSHIFKKILAKIKISAKVGIESGNEINVRSNRPAFSLLETVVVLFIVAVGLVAIMNLTVDSLKAQTQNRDTLIAYQLAQEGIELVRNVRDTNFLANSTTTPVAWNRYIVGSSTGSNYKVDFTHFQPILVNDITETRLQTASSSDANPGFYLYSTDPASPDSPFSRMITITAADVAAPSSTVTSLVQWEDQGATHKYQLQTVFYNWQ